MRLAPVQRSILLGLCTSTLAGCLTGAPLRQKDIARLAHTSAVPSDAVQTQSRQAHGEEESEPQSEPPPARARLLPPPDASIEAGDKSETERATSGPRPFTFDEIIAACLASDPKIRAGFEGVTQASADYLTSSLLPNPSLDVSGSLLPLRAFTVDRPGGPPQFDVGVGYKLDWLLFGKRVAAMSTASAGVRASQNDYEDLIRTRIQDAGLAVYDVMEAKGLLDMAREDLENLKQVENVTKKAVEKGGKAPLDLNRIRLDLLGRQRLVREAEAALHAAKAKLRSLIGRRDADPSFDVIAPLSVPEHSEALRSDEAYKLAEQNRPDLQALRERIAQAESGLLSERRKAFPEVSTKFGYTRQFQSSNGSPDASCWAVDLEVGLPIFDRNQGNRLKASSILVQNRFGLNTALVDLRAEIEKAAADYRVSLETARSVAEEQLKLAEQVRDAITKAWEGGGRSYIEVLDAQRNYRETYRLFISSRANYHRAVIRLNAAIGKQLTP
jgi:cobalt-zinc-cadmium efflux system outer membrane protein